MKFIYIAILSLLPLKSFSSSHLYDFFVKQNFSIINIESINKSFENWDFYLHYTEDSFFKFKDNSKQTIEWSFSYKRYPEWVGHNGQCVMFEDNVKNQNFKKELLGICTNSKLIQDKKLYTIWNRGNPTLHNFKILDPPNMTDSEVNALVSKLNTCITLPTGTGDISDIKVKVNIEVNEERKVKRAYVVDKNKMAETKFRSAAEAVLRSLNSPNCNPLPLPKEKYAIWKEINFTFDFAWMKENDFNPTEAIPTKSESNKNEIKSNNDSSLHNSVWQLSSKFKKIDNTVIIINGFTTRKYCKEVYKLPENINSPKLINSIFECSNNSFKDKNQNLFFEFNGYELKDYSFFGITNDGKKINNGIARKTGIGATFIFDANLIGRINDNTLPKKDNSNKYILLYYFLFPCFN